MHLCVLRVFVVKFSYVVEFPFLTLHSVIATLQEMTALFRFEYINFKYIACLLNTPDGFCNMYYFA